MYYGPYAPWEHFPKNLCYSEILAPLTVVAYFFDSLSPEIYVESLTKWRHYAISHKHYKDKRYGPETLLSEHEKNIKLLEAMYLLLLRHKVNREQPAIITAEQLNHEKEEWDFFPGNLTEKQLLKPYKAVNKIFKRMPPQRFREYLHEWLQAALSKRPIDENLTAGEVIAVYDNLLTLYSAAWVIYQREITRQIIS